MFTWQIRWWDTGELQERGGYRSPVTAWRGMVEFVRECLKYGERSLRDEMSAVVMRTKDRQPVISGARATVENYCDG